jgi:hypothetical protein
MTPDPNRPDVLLSVSSEIEAAAIVTALAEYGVQALTVGGYISGFQAAAPGDVAIVVKLADFDRAKQALAEIRQQQSDIDWSKVDVMETPEEPLLAKQTAQGAPNGRLNASRLWWIVELLGIVVCFNIWLITRELTPLLIYTVAAFALAGLFLALSRFASRRH